MIRGGGTPFDGAGRVIGLYPNQCRGQITAEAAVCGPHSYRNGEILKILLKLFRATTIALVMLCALALAVAAVVLIFEVPVSLEPFRPRIQALASQAIGRPLIISGPIRITPTLWPTIEINRLEIGNPTGFPGQPFLRVDALRGALDLIGLLNGRLAFGEVSSRGVRARLVRHADGETNWSFDLGQATPPSADAPARGAAANGPIFAGLERLCIENAFLTWEDGENSLVRELRVDRAVAAAPANAPIQLAAAGELFEQTFEVWLDGGPADWLITGDRPWPADLEAQLGETALQLNGSLEIQGAAPDWGLEVRLQGPNLQTLGAITGSTLPEAGPWALEARASGTALGVELTSLQASAGAGHLSASGLLDLSAPRPLLRAAVDLDRLDAAILQQLGGHKGESNAAQDAPGKPLSAADWKAALSAWDADVKLSVQAMVNAPAELHDTRVDLRISAGVLDAEIGSTLLGTPLRGKVRFDASSEILGLTANLAAEEADIARPAALVSGDDSVTGQLRSLDFRLSWEGEQLNRLLDDADLHLSLEGVDLLYGNDPSVEPVSLILDSVTASSDHGEPMELAAQGSLLGEAFALALSAGSLRQWLTKQPRPIHLTATGSGAELLLDGILQPMTATEGPKLSLNLSGKRFDELSPWTGVGVRAKLPYALSGDLQLTPDGWRINSVSARLGRSRVQGKLAGITSGTEHLYQADLRFPLLDLNELDRVLADTEKRQDRETEGLTIDLPILSRHIVIADADLNLSVDRLVLPHNEVNNIRLNAHIRDGHVKKAPFRAALGANRFTGNAKLDLRGATAAELSLAAQDVDVGDILRRLRLVEDLPTTARSLSTRIRLRGGDLDELLRESELRLTVEDGRLPLYDPNLQAKAMIHVRTGELEAQPGRPLAGRLIGTLDGVPVEIAWTTADLHTLATSRRRLPLHLEVDTSEAKLQLSAEVAFPLHRRDMDFSLSLEGRRLDDLNQLLLVSLPPWGPYSANGRLNVAPDGYHLSDLDLRVGGSDLIGHMDLLTRGPKPRLEVDLESRAIQLDDFRLGDWTPTDEAKAPSEAAGEGSPREPSERFQGLLAAEVMRSADAIVAIEVRDVLSGADHLGRGTLKAVLQDGRLELDPIEIDIPAGEVMASLSLDRSGDDIRAGLKTSIDQLDYGILARRADPLTEAAGLLSVDADLSFRDDDFTDLWRSADGQLSFAAWPENLRGDVFDVWAVNLFFAVLPRFGVGSVSKVNCLIANFDLTDGIMKDRQLVLDTSRVRVKGTGEVDLRSEKVDFLLRPDPKRPKFFSLATPLVVDGTFSDFRAGIAPGGVLETALRWSYAYVVVPIRLLTERSLPQDGSDICTPGVAQSAPASPDTAGETDATREPGGFSESPVP